MKLSNNDLQIIFSLAKQYYVNDDKGDLDDQQFIARCYLHAVSSHLKIDVELPERVFAEPTE